MAFRDLFTVKNDTTTVKLRSAQLNADTLSRIFNVDPDTVFLVGEDGTVAFPDSERTFDTMEMDCEVWTVNGNGRSFPTDASTSNPAPPKQKKWKPSIQSSLTPCGSGRLGKQKPESTKKGSTSWTKTVEVCCYDKSTSTVTKTFNLPLTLTEQSASVNKIADLTSAEAFDGDAVVVIDADNLRIPDSVGTRG